jgi:hypothetical protein
VLLWGGRVNNENLIPLNKRTKKEQREIAKKGGKKSGEVRREQKTYREMAKAMLSATITDENLLNELKAFGITETDVKAYTLLGMIKASGNGSHNAFDRLMELVGEKEQGTGNEAFNEGMQTLADLINNPAPNRNIADFEGDNDA